MTTKFSTRPSVRKRPWVCLKAPPCLPPPAKAKQLIATFSLRKLEPPPIPKVIQGTFSLLQLVPTDIYTGGWGVAGEFFLITITYPAPAGGDRPLSQWLVETQSDMGLWQRHHGQLPLPFWYQSGNPTHTAATWIGRLLVTS